MEWGLAWKMGNGMGFRNQQWNGVSMHDGQWHGG